VSAAAVTVVPPDSTAQGSDGQRRQHLRPSHLRRRHRCLSRLDQIHAPSSPRICMRARAGAIKMHGTSVSDAASSFQQEMSKG